MQHKRMLRKIKLAETKAGVPQGTLVNVDVTGLGDYGWAIKCIGGRIVAFADWRVQRNTVAELAAEVKRAAARVAAVNEKFTPAAGTVIEFTVSSELRDGFGWQINAWCKAASAHRRLRGRGHDNEKMTAIAHIAMDGCPESLWPATGQTKQAGHYEGLPCIVASVTRTQRVRATWTGAAWEYAAVGDTTEKWISQVD